jgi:DNA recombination protein RmuC
VSLKAYFDYMNSENKDEALKALKQSVQTHIDTLSKKNYQHLEGIDSPDFVYLFIPVEGVYSLILASFPEIIAESIKKNIVLVSPVNIMSNLRTVAALWRLEKQSKNAVEMANKAGAMYDKFVTVVDDIEKLGLHLGRAQASQEQLIKKISTGKGNLVNRAQELQELGAKTTKTMSKDVLD